MIVQALKTQVTKTNNTFFFWGWFRYSSSGGGGSSTRGWGTGLLFSTGRPQRLMSRGRVQYLVLRSGAGRWSKHAHNGFASLLLLSLLRWGGACAAAPTRIFTLAYLFVVLLDPVQDVRRDGLGRLTGLTGSTGSRSTTECTSVHA
jgi:hypothetical protein